MLKEVSTKDLVDELLKREGVNVFKAKHLNSWYQIKVKEPSCVTEREDIGLTTIKEDLGPAIILEVVG